MLKRIKIWIAYLKVFRQARRVNRLANQVVKVKSHDEYYKLKLKCTEESIKYTNLMEAYKELKNGL